MEYTICKLQYIGKTEAESNITINNHHKDVLKLNSFPADRHFAERDHDFNFKRQS